MFTSTRRVGCSALNMRLLNTRIRLSARTLMQMLFNNSEWEMSCLQSIAATSLAQCLADSAARNLTMD